MIIRLEKGVTVRNQFWQSNTVQRLVYGSISTAALLILLINAHHLLVQLLLTALLGLTTVGALIEFYGLCQKEGTEPETRFGLFVGGCYFLILLLGRSQALPLAFATLSLGAGALPFIFASKGIFSIGRVAMTLMGWCLIVIPLSCFLLIFQFPLCAYGLSGDQWLIFLLCVTKITDIGAYLSGRLCGHRLLAPKLSPKKTKEGAFGGLAFAIAMSCALWWGFGGMGSYGVPVIIGVSLSLLAQLGDLFESSFKRAVHLKDSGNLPAFGGVLDMVDSLLLAAPCLYLWLYSIGGLCDYHH